MVDGATIRIGVYLDEDADIPRWVVTYSSSGTSKVIGRWLAKNGSLSASELDDLLSVLMQQLGRHLVLLIPVQGTLW